MCLQDNVKNYWNGFHETWWKGVRKNPLNLDADLILVEAFNIYVHDKKKCFLVFTNMWNFSNLEYNTQYK